MLSPNLLQVPLTQYQPLSTQSSISPKIKNRKPSDDEEIENNIDFSAKCGYLFFTIILGFTAFFSILFMIFTFGFAVKKKEETPILLLLSNGAFSLMGYFIYQIWLAMSYGELKRARIARDGFIFSMLCSVFYFSTFYLCVGDERILILVNIVAVLHALFICGSHAVIKTLERGNEKKPIEINTFQNFTIKVDSVL